MKDTFRFLRHELTIAQLEERAEAVRAAAQLLVAGNEEACRDELAFLSLEGKFLHQQPSNIFSLEELRAAEKEEFLAEIQTLGGDTTKGIELFE